MVRQFLHVLSQAAAGKGCGDRLERHVSKHSKHMHRHVGLKEPICVFVKVLSSGVAAVVTIVSM